MAKKESSQLESTPPLATHQSDSFQMPEDLETVLNILACASSAPKFLSQRLLPMINTLAISYGNVDEKNAAVDFLNFLRQDQWKALRQWIARAETISLQNFLRPKAKKFFRERRQKLMADRMDNIPWDVVINKAIYLPPRDRVLAHYCLVEGLVGTALKQAVRSDLRLGLATTGAITTSRSNIIKRVREHCHPDHRDIIDVVLKLRQRSGRSLKTPKRAKTDAN